MLLFGRPHDDSKGQSSSIDTETSRRFDTALFSLIDTLEANRVDYALIGGIAACTHGRPRPTQDIDIFVRPEDADAVLEKLQEAGFETNRFNPSWIFKAYKENVLIDIIFRSEGNMYFDDEMNSHAVTVHFHGRPIRVVSPEDFILIKSAAHSIEGHHHWHDALSVLSQAQLNWDYLVHRARKAPRRTLALLIYAQSADIWIPNAPVQKLYQTIFNDGAGTKHSEHKPPDPRYSKNSVKAQVRNELGDTYLASKVREALEKSEKTGALDVEIFIQEGKILVRGEVPSEEQHHAIVELIKETAPGLQTEDQLHVSDWQAPKEVEALR